MGEERTPLGRQRAICTLGLASALLLIVGLGAVACGRRAEAPPSAGAAPGKVARQEVPAGGGVVTVKSAGDSLDGLSIEVPADAYAAATTFAISHAPAPAGEGLYQPITPLITIENGGAYADEPLVVRIPAQVPEGQFAMAFTTDAAGKALEGVPVLAEGAGTVVVATRHFSPIVVTAADYADLERANPTTGFTPGVDTWQIENRGTFEAPDGLCWGMNVTALWYYLEEPWQVDGRHLWGQYDNSLGAGRETDGLWQDDDFAVHVASAVQATQAGARPDDENNLLRLREEEAKQVGERVSVQLTAGELAYYQTVYAMAVTGKPQLLRAGTTDRKSWHSLICYRAEGRTLYVADPNDYERYPMERTVTLQSDRTISPHTSAGNLIDYLLGRTFEYRLVEYWGLSALTHWQEVGRIWRAGDRQDGYPEYRLMVVERDANGAVTQEYDLDVLSPLVTTQDRLELDIIPPTGLAVQMYLSPYADPQALQEEPLALAMGENLVGVYVQGLATWREGGVSKTDWRWLGYDWVRVIREAPTPTPAATATAVADDTVTPSPTPPATPTPAPAGVTFLEGDCLCSATRRLAAGVLMDHAALEPNGLSCSYQASVNCHLESAYAKIRLPVTEEEAAQQFAQQRGFMESNIAGQEVTILLDQEAPGRYTRLGRKDSTTADLTARLCPDAEPTPYIWLAERVLLYRGAVVWVRVAGVHIRDEGEALAQLDAQEACATAALDRALAAAGVP